VETTTRAREALRRGGPVRPRKIHLDSDLYCPHSVRASAGDARCDHDFESAPSEKREKYAVWNCTRCGRSFRYETWSAAPRPIAR
jgi:ABC-type ATPase with predicted acetyltransferase domain